MDDLFILKQIIDSATSGTPSFILPNPPPLFSFEGLPGAGKSTQIRRVSAALTAQFGKSRYIDLPTSSHIGLLLKALYTDYAQFAQVSSSAPWLNPLLLSLDLALTLRSMAETGEWFALMSRGILSTYYYNIGPYVQRLIDEQEAWNMITRHLSAFQRPSAIIFLELPVEEAHRRVVSRNRGSLRVMDQQEQMHRDRETLSRYLTRFDDKIPIHYIDAGQPEEAVTEDIVHVMKGYLHLNA